MATREQTVAAIKNLKAIKASANSKKIIDKVIVFQSLNKALLSFNYVIATSNRKRFLQKPIHNNFKKFFNYLDSVVWC